MASIDGIVHNKASSIKASDISIPNTYDEAICCENDKEHSELVGHHLLGCLLDAMYDPYIPVSRQ
jgi:hypothetical protein